MEDESRWWKNLRVDSACCKRTRLSSTLSELTQNEVSSWRPSSERRVAHRSTPNSLKDGNVSTYLSLYNAIAGVHDMYIMYDWHKSPWMNGRRNSPLELSAVCLRSTPGRQTLQPMSDWHCLACRLLPPRWHLKVAFRGRVELFTGGYLNPIFICILTLTLFSKHSLLQLTNKFTYLWKGYQLCKIFLTTACSHTFISIILIFYPLTSKLNERSYLS